MASGVEPEMWMHCCKQFFLRSCGRSCHATTHVAHLYTNTAVEGNSGLSEGVGFIPLAPFHDEVRPGVDLLDEASSAELTKR